MKKSFARLAGAAAMILALSLGTAVAQEHEDKLVIYASHPSESACAMGEWLYQYVVGNGSLPARKLGMGGSIDQSYLTVDLGRHGDRAAAVQLDCIGNAQAQQMIRQLIEVQPRTVARLLAVHGY